MDYAWRSYNAWIAYFDLLGFEAKLKTEPMFIIQQEVEEIVAGLGAEAMEFEKDLAYLFYADTFIVYSKSDEDRHYPGLRHAARHFMEKCIHKGIALRGAISYGEIAVGHNSRIMIGRAFLESHIYCEDQDWVGLVLTPTASNRLKRIKLNPTADGFVCGETPLRNCSGSSGEVYAFTFRQGPSSYPCPLLHQLRQMRLLSPEDCKPKYSRTIEFLEKHWQRIQY